MSHSASSSLLTICLPVANLYAQPHQESQVVSQALYGWHVQLLDEHQTFKQVQMADGYIGWINNQELTSFNFQETTQQKQKLKIKYRAAPVYDTPHVNRRRPLWILPFEVELPILAEPEEEEGRWIQVALVEGRAGWIQRGHVELNAKVLSLKQMLELSHQFMGLPYIWGGTSSFGYDCSGFVQMLGRQRGICLPRDARQQFCDAACDPIAEEDLAAGDLLFFGNHEREIRHVGLYLGEQRLIHASVKPIPVVQYSQLDEPSLTQRFAYRAVRRLSFDCVNG
jgi:cell wall-associated NlpC family hydrolase